MRPVIRVVGAIAGALLQRARVLPPGRPAARLPSLLRRAVERTVDLNLLKIVINITRP